MVALPDGVAEGAAGFEQVSDLPVWEAPRARATVFVGQLDGARSSARVHTPLLGAEVALDPGADVRRALVPGFEHAVLVLGGTAEVAGTAHSTSGLLYLGDGRDHVRLRSAEVRGCCSSGVRLRARPGHVVELRRPRPCRRRPARADWESDDRAERFGLVAGHDGARIPAPELPNIRLQPRRPAPPQP